MIFKLAGRTLALVLQLCGWRSTGYSALVNPLATPYSSIALFFRRKRYNTDRTFLLS
jgi:hypothetical protein